MKPFKSEKELCKGNNGYVKIIIGENEDDCYDILEEVLCYHVDFFRDMFEDEWKNTTSPKVVRFREEEPATFELFAQWLRNKITKDCSADKGLSAYSLGRTSRFPIAVDSFAESVANGTGDTFGLNCIKLWNRADKWCIDELAKIALLEYRLCIDARRPRLPTQKEIEYLFETNEDGSELIEEFKELLVVNYYKETVEIGFWTLLTGTGQDFFNSVLHAIGAHSQLPPNECNIANCSAHNDMEIE